MLIVLPALIMRGLYWVWSLFTGKKAPTPEPTNNAGEPEVKKAGTCPYHVFMNFFGFKIPEKKTPVVDAKDAPKSGEQLIVDNQLKTE